MNFSEAMQMLGTKLQGKYGHLGFKYKKSDKTLTRHSKNFTYMIAFSSFGGNTKDSISIEVCYIINTRPYDPYGYAKPDANTQPLFYSLRDNEIYLDIGNEEKIDIAFEVVCQYPVDGTIDSDGQYSKADIPEHTQYDTQSLAKFAFSVFWRAMRFAEEQQVPILLDY